METTYNADLVFYPAFCFKVSPTHFAWVKMAAADVQRLRRPRSYNGQSIFFYKNHPIRFVCVVGVIIARTDVTRRTILTLDDSSGTTLEICVLHADPKTRDNAHAQMETMHDLPSIPNINGSYQSPITSGSGPRSLTQVQTHTMRPEHVSATDGTILDISSLQPGMRVKVKGTLSQFRSTMQLNLERFTLVRDTNAEMQFVDQRLRFLVEVLAVPWTLSPEEIAQCRADAERGEVKVLKQRERAERRVKRQAEREARDYYHIQKRYEREERKRAKEALLSREDGVKLMRDIQWRKALASNDAGHSR
ncbi:hypothetical protein N7539_001116 [Penicillium diatomitis]|uniref:CST complex subunit Stn1 N-terminal domain-containing protein n=1 Tax=Penicillium diatomitis TaxID=2819901 RepID=A0A9X0C3A6_9EURO|nr:uncharacterized protein N7539_001116 [Penicillium diatomitis]KAJ5496000.1 hypothetical protein N7539_001116 [Penicillium diatomitis]